MKYIRTKDGIYQVNSSNYTILEGFITVNALDKGIIGIREVSVIKQADNIEDLCDKFVWFTTPHYYEIYDDFEDIEDCYHAENVSAIYGAIWTDKGLIFVAKLKERKLELL